MLFSCSLDAIGITSSMLWTSVVMFTISQSHSPIPTDFCSGQTGEGLDLASENKCLSLAATLVSWVTFSRMLFLTGPQGGVGCVFNGYPQTLPMWESDPCWRGEGNKVNVGGIWLGKDRGIWILIRQKSAWETACTHAGHLFLNSVLARKAPFFPFHPFPPSPLQTSRILCLLLLWACSLEKIGPCDTE